MIVLYRKISITSNSIQHFLQQILIFFNKKPRNIAISDIPRNIFDIIGATSAPLRTSLN